MMFYVFLSEPPMSFLINIQVIELDFGVKVYLIDYIFCIIDCHICRDIFGRIHIMYYILSYVSRYDLSLKTLILYIPVERHNTIQPTIILNLFFLYGNQSLFFLSSYSLLL
jgi:hypothetical protein